MLKVITKKNCEYSVKERWFAGICTAIVCGLFGYWSIFDADSLPSENILPVGAALLIGLVAGAFGFKFPKVINIALFALPLLIFTG